MFTKRKILNESTYAFASDRYIVNRCGEIENTKMIEVNSFTG